MNIPIHSPITATLASVPDQACRMHRFGPPSVIVLEDVERPEPGFGEVLVRIRAAGVGPWDALLRAGRGTGPRMLPLTLGSELSGVVVALGPGVTDFRAGDAVFGVTIPGFTGAYADYAVAPTGMIARKPDRLDHIDAASVPVAAVTAWQALFKEAGLVRGRTVLIHGAAGNAGAYAVQLARWAGLRVIATASGRNLAFVRGLGADIPVDYRADRFEDTAHGVDAVIDLVGGVTQARSFAVLRRGGILISAASAPDPALAERYGVRAGFFRPAVTAQRLADIAHLFDQGRLATQVGAVLPLAAARMAHEMLEGTRPRPRGKIVLRVSD